MAAVDLSLLGRDLPDLMGYRAALSRSSVALSSEFNLPTDRHQLASQRPYRADQRQRFQRPFSAAQRNLDDDAAVELSRLNLRPFSSASTREVIAEAQRIVDKYRLRTLSGRWPTDSDTRRSLESARRVAPRQHPQLPSQPLRKSVSALGHVTAYAISHRQQQLRLQEAREDKLFEEEAAAEAAAHGEEDGGHRQHHHQPALRSPAALFADPRRRSLATPLASQQQRWHSRTEVEARREAMRILRDVGLADVYRSQAELQESQQQQQRQRQLQHSRHPHHEKQLELTPPQPPPHPNPDPQPHLLPPATALDEYASGPRALRTPLASSGYASYEDFQARTAPTWRHPLPIHVAAGFCDESTRKKVWDWLTAPDQLSRHDYLMKLCD